MSELHKLISPLANILESTEVSSIGRVLELGGFVNEDYPRLIDNGANVLVLENVYINEAPYPTELEIALESRQYLITVLERQARRILLKADEMLIAQDTDTAMGEIGRFSRYLKMLKGKYQGKSENIKSFLPTMEFNLDRLIEGFDERIIHFGTEEKASKPTKKTEKPFQRLKWNSGPTTLGTLFHELRVELMTPDGKPYIEATHSEIKDFIIRSFVDENGEPFSDASIKTITDANRNDKKAKRNKVETSLHADHIAQTLKSKK